jgi:uncharacterized protein YbjT (DUF2867 family)
MPALPEGNHKGCFYSVLFIRKGVFKMADKLKVLVYGGTGSQGGAVVRKLLEAGHEPYIVTRNPEKAAEFVRAGAKTVRGEMSDPASLESASRGVDAVALMIPFSIPDPALAASGARNAIDAAKKAGVKLIVYNTSGSLMAERTGNPAFDIRLDTVEYLENSGVPSIVVAPTAYMENLLGPWTRNSIIEQDVLAYPAPAFAPIGWIASDDNGALIVAALERPELAGTRFTVSGVENLTGAQLAERFSQGLGRTITYHEMPLEEFGAILDNMFGPGAGAGAIATYQFQRDHADKMTMWTDMRPVLEKLPVRMTGADEWATRFAPAFAPAKEAASV